MTLSEKVQADLSNSQVNKVDSFGNAFRSLELGNLQDGEIITIPEDYTIFERAIGRGDDARKACYINVPTNTGRTVQLYPTSIVRVAFPVDENGKNIKEDGRTKIVRSSGDVVDFVQGKAIDATMAAMKGCSIEYKVLDRVKTRAFGVPEAMATKNDVNETIVGSWNFSGKKRPVGYPTK